MKRVIQVIKRCIDHLFFVSLRPLFRPRPATHRVFVIVRTDGIGDMAYFCRFVGGLRKRYGAYRFTIVCPEGGAIVARRTGLFDEILPYRSRQARFNLLYRLSLILRMRGLRPAVSLYASYHRQHFGDELVLLSGAQDTIVLSGNDESMEGWMLRSNNRRYHRVVDVPDHTPERLKYQRLYEVLGVDAGKSEADVGALMSTVNKYPVSPEVAAFPEPRSYAVIAPGGSVRIRRWPKENYIALIRSLEAEHRLDAVIAGGSEERDLLDSIRDASPDRCTVCWDRPLEVVIDIIRRSSLFIGNDSGLLHVAAMHGVPAVGIIGGGHFSRYFPYNTVRVVHNPLECYECNWRCVHPAPYCITDISVDAAMREVRSIVRQSCGTSSLGDRA